ncbi:unnamed protein product [Orchesella dallaii]|uniref:WD_REPEATS_REGION domain-containing protein n=1 Tax=Orchesella dallaii TaxID=48710 RepID=A0ABP1R3P2_9HEXA
MSTLDFFMVTPNKDQSNNALMEGEGEPPSPVTILANDPEIEVGLEIECEYQKEDSLQNNEQSVLIIGYADRGTYGLTTWLVDSKAKEYVTFSDIYAAFHPISMQIMNFTPKDNAATRYIAVGFSNSEIHVLKMNEDGSPESSTGLGSLQNDYIRHTDAVMDLSWNRNITNVLASGSADKTVIVWDMNTSSAAARLECFSEKVQSVKWHPIEAQSLLTGCCDGFVKLFDGRTPGINKSWGFEGEINRIMWNKFEPLHFFASTGKGMVHYVDIRATNSIWNLNAHTSAVGGLALSSYCKDMLVTGSQDETAKVWDLKDDSPSLLSEFRIGKIHVISACPDSPYVFATGGANPENPCYVFDVRDPVNVVKPFRERQIAQQQPDSTPSSFDMMDLASALP